ncbi:MAG: helix-turn-helix transcriptional regulator [Phaeodactylibacter sp.]|nr:helix-turn-helix transcriptional regulator [Phaeodactylibacter sp.]
MDTEYSPDLELQERVAAICKTLGHPIRMGILVLLHEQGAQSVSDLTRKLEKRQTVVSQHLNIMQLQGLLSSERIGKFMYYELHFPDCGMLFSLLCHISKNCTNPVP